MVRRSIPRVSATLLAATVALTAAACGADADRAATVSQSWSGVSPTGNALDLGYIVTGIISGDDRAELAVVPATAPGTATATCSDDAARLTVDGWTIETTRGSQTLQVVNDTAGFGRADIDASAAPAPELAESITWHDDGRIDLTVAAETPHQWSTQGRFYVGATITCADTA